MDDETIRFLIERKVDFLNSVAQVCMIWWASCVVFCGSILAGVWSKREELKENKVLHWLGIILLVFFSSVVIFGYLVTDYLWHLENEIVALANSLKFQGRYFQTELLAFRRTMWTGNSSFILVLFVWICMWVWLARGERTQIPSEQSEVLDGVTQPPPNKELEPNASQHTPHR